MIDLHLDRKIFNEKYYPYIYQYNEPIEIFYGGGGSGKSVFIAQKILLKALTDKRKVLVVRKVGNSLRESCWRLFLDLLSQWKIYSYCKVRISDMSIELPNGSILLFKGLDDPEKIKSIVGITDVWIEEGTELSEEDYLQLSIRMRSQKKDMQMFLSFNPVSKSNWVYKRWFIEEAKEKPFILHTTYKDNKFLTKQYIETLENLINTNPTYYRIYALGEFCSLDKLIFNNWEEREFDYREIKGELCCGLDFGFSADLLCFVAYILIERTKEIYIFKEYTALGLTNPEIANVIKSLGFSKSTIIADAAEPKSIKELRDNGITRIRACKKGPDSIRAGIQKLQEYKMIVHPDCHQVKLELENYSWKKDSKTGEYINQPIDEFNHACDSIRYALQCVHKKIKAGSKNALGL